MTRAVHHHSAFDGGREYAFRQSGVHSGSAYGLRSHHLVRERIGLSWWLVFVIPAAIAFGCIIVGAFR